jgi:membrane-associated protein
MNDDRFLSSNLLGSLSWGVWLTLTGYFAAIPCVKSAAPVISGVLMTTSIVGGIRTWRIERPAQSGCCRQPPAAAPQSSARPVDSLPDPLTTPASGA